MVHQESTRQSQSTPLLARRTSCSTRHNLIAVTAACQKGPASLLTQYDPFYRTQISPTTYAFPAWGDLPDEIKLRIGITSVSSDPFGRTASEIVFYFLTHTSKSLEEKTVRKVIKKKATVKSGEIIEAFIVYNIETDQAKSWSLPVVIWNILTI